MIGRHLLKTFSRQQKTIALSSAEAELYGMTATSSELLGMQACAADLGIKVAVSIYADASAALGIVQRRGIGRVRHVKTQSLWLQEAHAQRRIAFEKVDGSRNPADLLTKHVPELLLDRHLEYLSCRPEDGRAATAPTLSSLGLNVWPLYGFELDNVSVEPTTLKNPVGGSSMPILRDDEVKHTNSTIAAKTLPVKSACQKKDRVAGGDVACQKKDRVAGGDVAPKKRLTWNPRVQTASMVANDGSTASSVKLEGSEALKGGIEKPRITGDADQDTGIELRNVAPKMQKLVGRWADEAESDGEETDCRFSSRDVALGRWHTSSGGIMQFANADIGCLDIGDSVISCSDRRREGGVRNLILYNPIKDNRHNLSQETEIRQRAKQRSHKKSRLEQRNSLMHERMYRCVYLLPFGSSDFHPFCEKTKASFDINCLSYTCECI